MAIDSVGFILRRDQEILVERRAQSKRTDPGKWCVPSGGVEGEESFEEAMLREVREELDVKPLSYDEVCKTVYEPNDVAFRMRYYVVDSWQGSIKRREADALEWRDIIPSSVDIEPDKEALHNLRERG